RASPEHHVEQFMPLAIGNLDGARRIHFPAFAGYLLDDGAPDLGGLMFGCVQIGKLAARLVDDQPVIGSVMEVVAWHGLSLTYGINVRLWHRLPCPGFASVWHPAGVPSSPG